MGRNPGVNPARAGMILSLSEDHAARDRKPRASGDDPAQSTEDTLKVV